MTTYVLDEREAFETMVLFLLEYHGRGGRDLGLLLSDIEIQADGLTKDPAAWDDWIRCVKKVKQPKA